MIEIRQEPKGYSIRGKAKNKKEFQEQMTALKRLSIYEVEAA